MRRSRWIAPIILALALLPAAASAQGSTPPNFRDEFLRQFRNSAMKLEELAQAMPTEKYAWSPGPGVMPVAQVYAHIARYNYYYPQSGLGVAPPQGTDLATMEQVADKDAVVRLLKESNRHVIENIGRMPESQLGQPAQLYGRQTAQWAVLFQLLAHMNEHLGQSISYARMNGVVPPWSQ